MTLIYTAQVRPRRSQAMTLAAQAMLQRTQAGLAAAQKEGRIGGRPPNLKLQRRQMPGSWQDNALNSSAALPSPTDWMRDLVALARPAPAPWNLVTRRSCSPEPHEH